MPNMAQEGVQNPFTSHGCEVYIQTKPLIPRMKHNPSLIPYNSEGNVNVTYICVCIKQA